MHTAAFSSDGTILAFAHGLVVTLWDVETNVLLKVLDATQVNVSKVVFVGAEGRYLVGAGATKGLTVWDLLSCEGEFLAAIAMYRR